MHAIVRFDSTGNLEVSTHEGTTLKAGLTRLQAQNLAHQILSLCGPTRKSLDGRQDSVAFPATLLGAPKAATVKASKPKVRVVRLSPVESRQDAQKRELEIRKTLPQSAWDPSCPKW